ncbi:MAG: response regulator [Prolixibacteraceae bacterium]|nr:response regulator [Prolixibacteraceae bacterium]
MQKKLLIVDDNPEARTILKGVFNKEGYWVETAPDGAGCLNELKKSKPDLMLLHKAVLGKYLTSTSAVKSYYIKDESRILPVELMGYLLTHYRNKS